MVNIAMVVSNPFRPDPRVYREAKTLVDHGLKVAVIAWDRECKYPSFEIVQGIPVYRVRLRSSNNLFSFIVTLPIFWLYATVKILLFLPTVVIIHCHDFDTVPVGILIKIFRPRVKIIYDAHELYPAMVSNVSKILYILLSVVDRLFLIVSNCVIIPSEERRIFYNQAKCFHVVPNTPKIFIPPKNFERHMNDFIIFYGGGLSDDNGILFVIKTVLQLPGMKLVLAGTGPLKPLIEKLSKKYNKIQYLGFLSQKEIFDYLSRADVTVIFYAPTNVNNLYPASNKFYEAMMMGVPIITNSETILAHIVEKFKCGVIVPYGDVGALKKELTRLKEDPELRRQLGENGKKAFREKFAWDLLENDFVRHYLKMLSKGVLE